MECEYAWEKYLSYSTSFVITASISYIYLCTGVIVWSHFFHSVGPRN